MKIIVYDEPVEITQDNVAKAREHFAQISDGLAEDALAHKISVNDLERYVARSRVCAVNWRAGTYDNSLTCIQYALWLQTGRSVPLLSANT